MKILIATDKFKDCLTASEVSDFLMTGLKKASSIFEIRCMAIADGGEGTSEALINALNGEKVYCEVHDPLMRKIKAGYVILKDGKTAVIEMSAASGLALLHEDERNPWDTTSYGTGELILDAFKKGCSRFIIGIGGSATNDGGAGMARALGINFLDNTGKEIDHGGGALLKINKIEMHQLPVTLKQSEFIIACDVLNPLTGKNGASYVYGPQKGADEKMVMELEKNLLYFSEIISKQLGKDVKNIPGSGAAGGLGAGFLAFLDAHLENGFEIIRKETNLDGLCKWADIVITGEGKLDFQTSFGKAPQGVARTAKLFHKPVIAIAGSLGKDYTQLYASGFDAVFSIINQPMSLEESIKKAPQLLEELAYSIGKTLLIAHKS